MATATPNPAIRIVKWACVFILFATAAASFLSARGCQLSREHRAAMEGDRFIATIGGKKFRLEPALDGATRLRGLGGRVSIEEDGGMVFVFPAYLRQNLSFLMRDCPVDIDIAFLDDSGHVLTVYEMKSESPRSASETPTEYESRLRRYPSRYPSRIAVEVRGGELARLGVKPGDLIEADWDSLKQRAK